MTDSFNSKNDLFSLNNSSLFGKDSPSKASKDQADSESNSNQKEDKKEEDNRIWLSISEAAKLGGVQNKTIRRAIKADKDLKYKIVKNKYRIEIQSLVNFMYTNRKLENKFNQKGLGQYVKKWKKTKS